MGRPVDTMLNVQFQFHTCWGAPTTSKRGCSGSTGLRRSRVALELLSASPLRRVSDTILVSVPIWWFGVEISEVVLVVMVVVSRGVRLAFPDFLAWCKSCTSSLGCDPWFDLHFGASTQSWYFVEPFLTLGWYSSYCAAQLVNGTSEKGKKHHDRVDAQQCAWFAFDIQSTYWNIKNHLEISNCLEFRQWPGSDARQLPSGCRGHRSFGRVSLHYPELKLQSFIFRLPNDLVCWVV